MFVKYYESNSRQFVFKYTIAETTFGIRMCCLQTTRQLTLSGQKHDVVRGEKTLHFT